MRIRKPQKRGIRIQEKVRSRNKTNSEMKTELKVTQK